MKIKNAATIELKAGPDDGLAEGQFTAYASVFGNKDSYGDVVVKGAFENTLKEWESGDALLPLLFGHRLDDPDYNIGHVTKAVEDDRGLLVTGQLDLEAPKALATYRLLKGRRINQMSYAYDVVDGSQVERDGEKFYELRELKLHEVSVVPIGANQETEVLAVKAGADMLVSGLKAGRVLSAKNESSLRAAHEEIGNVLNALAKPADGGEEDTTDQDETSGSAPAKDEEPSGVKSEEPMREPSVETLAAIYQYYALTVGAEEGSS